MFLARSWRLIPLWLLCFSPAMAAERSDEDPAALALQVRDILGLKGDGGEALEPIAECVANAKRPDVMPAAAKRLAQAVNRADLTRLAEDLSAATGVGDEYGAAAPAGWKYGLAMDRLHVAGYLWDQMKGGTLPNDEAKEMGRAALLLAALEGQMLAGPLLENMVKDMSEGRARLLDDAELGKLKEVLATQKDRVKPYSVAHNKARNSVFRLAEEAKFPVPAARIASVLEDIKNARALAPDQWARFRVIDFAWCLRNIAKTENDANALAAVERFLTDWQAHPENRVVERWAGEAIKTDGPPPKVWRKP